MGCESDIRGKVIDALGDCACGYGVEKLTKLGAAQPRRAERIVIAARAPMAPKNTCITQSRWFSTAMRILKAAQQGLLPAAWKISLPKLQL